MEALLPSEIARLVLGYLEDQQCTEAAKQFLESSPHLLECRTVASRGKKFSTKVNGLTLTDIVEKFCAISAIIQERLNKATDCEQLKHCGDLIEQLKFLVEEPRGQRFVVNINVPSQNNTQASNGSPIIANSMRRRRHSNSERNKRPIKSHSNTTQQPDVVTTSPTISHNVDTTPLESLPGNVDMFKQAESINDGIEKEDNNVAHESFAQYDFEKNDEIWNSQHFETDIDGRKNINIMTSTPSLKRCTTATNTEELLQFSSAEVQTNPYEIPESESESNDEPIENLSILTKEILNRTELQECIAENINRAIIPTDLSLRDECFNESVGGEGNTSIVAELNNAIKSIVEATETDPVFEKFLDEIIGPQTETDTSPEEDGEGKQTPKFLNEAKQDKQIETAFGNVSSPEPTIIDTRASAENNTADLPLKHRLRSSSRQQNNRIEDEAEKAKDQEKEQSSLEDQNAAAILSIVNANIINNASDEKKTLEDTKESMIAGDITEEKVQMISTAVSKEDIATRVLTSVNVQRTSNVASSAGGNTESKVKKTTVKRPRPTRPKRDQTVNDNQVMKQEITTPTLVVCSKEEISNLLSMNHSSTSTSRFIPIAPKDSSRIAGSMETMYFKTVNLAQKLPIVVDEPGNSTLSQALPQSQRITTKVSKTVKTMDKVTSVIVDPRPLISTQPVQMIGKLATGESQVITLYGNESSAKTSLDSTNMPTISLEENISLSESGLSPYLKFNCNKISQNHNLSDIDLTPMIESAKCTAVTTTIDAISAEQQTRVSSNTDIITKRTPKSLLKSRSKNRRLSLSTPRKRSSHIRALDFSTPPKAISSARKTNTSETKKRLKSVCRTSLFKSPSFSNPSAIPTQKQQSPVMVCQPYKIPIATRSPAPKLIGGWDKFNGVGVIIGDVSSHGSTSASSSSEDRVQHKTSKAPVESWDADLRKSIQSNEKDETEVKKSTKRKHNKDENIVAQKRSKYSQQSTKSKDKRKSCDAAQKTEDESHEYPQKNVKTTTTEKNHNVTVNASDRSASKSDKISGSDDVPEISMKTNTTSAPSNDATVEKKPVKKYVQLKTIRTNLKKFNDDDSKKSTEDVSQTANSSQVPDLSRILSSTNTQHILRMPDMIDLETPKKFDNDGMSMPPPTPRMLSPNNNAITPFIKLSEDSSKLRSSFISTPEFPITPCITLTPKHTEETTRDVLKKNEYRSPYYEPTCEQAAGEKDEISKFKNITAVNMESPVISSSRNKLQSTHNSLDTTGAPYQACTSTTKLEITQFEVIKGNLPKEEAIKELKIASNNTKNSTIGLNAVTSSTSVVAMEERHVDLIRIDELPNANDEPHLTSIFKHNYTTENDSTSSSDISSSSDSSSSSSTSTTDSSSSYSSPNKSNFSPAKSMNAHKDTNVAEAMQKDENNPDINPAIMDESSPKKVFAIEKTDDQLQETSQETPAKDETLLNEADISETPSGSKSGIENLTNLSTKISAIITEDEKLSKLNKSQKDGGNKILNRGRSKPKVTNVQYIQPQMSELVIEEFLKPAANEPCAPQPTVPTYNKLIVQLEEKRQRMIAKIRDAPKSNIASGTRKRILMTKASNDARNKSAQFTRLNIKQTAPSRHPQGNRGRDKPAKIPLPQTSSQDSNPAKNTRKRCELQKQSSTSGCEDRDEDKRKQVNLSTTMSQVNKPLNDSETNQTHVSNVDNVKNNSLENCNSIETESVRSHVTKSSLEERDSLREQSNAKENGKKNCNVNVGEEEVGMTFADDNAHTKISETEVKPAEKHVVVQETLINRDKMKLESHELEDRASKSKQSMSHVDKAKSILKCKVDQVKRDLFSDEENDQRSFSCVTTSQRDKIHKRTEQISTFTKEVSIVLQENVQMENPKEELSSVLQCLQLVPAHKNENEQGQNGKQQQLLNDDRSKRKDTNEDNSDKSDQKTINVPNYKVEYHFVYDDNVPVRKRRRRYSGHELQIKINYADLSDPNGECPMACIKLLKAIEFEEIFNLQPKNSKKRTLNNKKTSHKNEIAKTDNEVFISRDNMTKQVVASSAMDESSGVKIKKLPVKTTAASRTSNDSQSDLKKKPKSDKAQEKAPETTVKNRKRKLSETKETKQIEKSSTTDPQILLSNIDLNKFLTSVHGPE